MNNISRPAALAYDPDENRVYWTDIRLKIIARAFINGTSIEVIVEQNAVNADGLAIDWINRGLYWTDTGTDKLEAARLDGTSRKTVASGQMDEPRAIVLDPLKR